MKKYSALYKIIIAFFLFLVIGSSGPLYAQNEYQKKFTQTCDSINFMTIQFLVKKEKKEKKGKAYNLYNFTYDTKKIVYSTFKDNSGKYYITGIDVKVKRNGKYINGMLRKYINYYYKTYTVKKGMTLDSLCNYIEHTKQNYRKKIHKEKDFNKQLKAFVDSVKNIITQIGNKSENGEINGFFTKLDKYKQEKLSNTTGNKSEGNTSTPSPTSKSTNTNTTDSHQAKGTTGSPQETEAKTGTTKDNTDKKITHLQEEITSIKTTFKEIEDKINESTDVNKKIKSIVPITYIALILAFLVFAIFIIYLILSNQKSKKQARHQETLHFLNKTTFPHYNHALDDINNRMKSLTSELNELKRNLNLYNTKVESIQQHLEKESDSVQNTNTQNIVEKPEAETYTPVPIKRYYLPVPAPQGFFWDDKKSETESTRSFFILEISTLSSGMGKFTLNLKNKKNIKSALANYATFLKPVCNSIDNNFSGNSIEVVEEGTLLLKEGKWSIAGGKKLTIKIV